MMPLGADVERLALAMAAGSGIDVAKVDASFLDLLRRNAHHALLRLGMSAKTEGKAHLAGRLDALSETLQKAAERLGPHGGTDGLIDDAYRAAAEFEAIARILRGMPDPAFVTAPAVLDESARDAFVSAQPPADEEGV